MLEHSPLEEIMVRAHVAEVTRMVTVSTEEANWEINQKLASAYEGIYFSLGVHPHEASHWNQCREKLKTLLAQRKTLKKCVAIGEIGLDFYYHHSPKTVQIDAFEAQLQLAHELDLPVIIHCRDAFRFLFESIKKIGLPPGGGVMHCFTGKVAEAKRSLDLGLKISFSGMLTFKKAQQLRDIAKLIPRSEIFVETDCPFLAPMPHRGKPNEPSFLPFTAETLAVVLNLEVDVVCEFTTQNAVNFFQIDEK